MTLQTFVRSGRLPDFAGATVAVLASGPSLTAEQADTVRNEGLRVVAVSDAYRFAPHADMLYSADHRWWQLHFGALQSYKGHRVIGQLNAPPHDMTQITPSGIGRNSGYQAIELSMALGARRILMLGFDMRGTHFFGEHPAPLRNTTEKQFQRWIEQFNYLRLEAERRGCDLLNCTPGSAVRCLRMVTLKDALNETARSAQGVAA